MMRRHGRERERERWGRKGGVMEREKTKDRKREKREKNHWQGKSE